MYRGKQPQGLRVRSIRSLRERAAMLRRWAEEGRISWSDYRSALAGVKVEGELFLAEHLMVEAGGDQEAEKHPLGDLGGFDPEEHGVVPRQNVRRRITVRKGLDRHGFPVDQVTVVTDGGEDLDEVEAEVASLM